MSPENYTKNVLRTESPSFYKEKVNTRLMHGVIGACTEAIELLDAVKKALFYGKELDIVNIHEEVGDLMYYVFLIIEASNGDFNDILERNIAKLKARYPEKFDSDLAINRDLKSEREILEGGDVWDTHLD
jgi:NTP pyrophosphatase (non-canonical NTP hydrolase)